MFQSFIVYGIFGFALFLFGYLSYIRELQSKYLNIELPFFVWEVCFILLVFSFFSGVRWNVGVDYNSYLINYLKIQKRGYALFEKEIGFDYLTYSIAELGFHFSVYFGILAFLQLFFIYYTFKKERYLYPYLGVLILFGPEYLNWMNGIRQTLAATIFVFSLQYIRNREFWKYSLVILIATTIHLSALFLLIFYFILRKDYFSSRLRNYIIVIITIYVGSMPELIFSLLPFWHLDITNFRNFEIGIIGIRETAFGPRRAFLFALNCILIWYAPILKKHFYNTNFITYFNFTIIGFLYFNLFANTSHIFLRPVIYFTIFLVITSAYLLDYLQKTEGITIKYITFLSISISYLIFSIIADAGKRNYDYTNYKFFWDFTH